MSERFEKLDDKLKAFLLKQHLYFVGKAGAQGFVNVSPKGMDSFRILGDATVAWLNLTSCGYVVPYYEPKGDRPTLTKWSDNCGEAGILDYWAEKNMKSLHDEDTGIL